MLETRNVRPQQAAQYYSRENYARQDALKTVSRWLGQGSKTLKLSGAVQQDKFEAVLQGYSPKGHRLRSRGATQQGYKERAALDCTFAAPKSISLLALVADQPRVIRAHQAAIAATLQVIEQRFAQTRIRVGGQRLVVETGNLVIATFRHDVSRELNPHLHTHCLLMNCTQANGRWYSLHNDAIHQHKKWLGMLYQHELALGIQKLGYQIQLRNHGQFEICGFEADTNSLNISYI